jgi:glycosyltransferase involved in cell wall biosynthesis
MLKILIVSPTPLDRGGLRFAKLGRGMVSRGHDVTILAPVDSDPGKLFSMDFETDHLSHLKMHIGHHMNSFTNTILASAVAMRYVKPSDYDICHIGSTMFPSDAVIALKAKFFSSTSVIVDWDDYFPSSRRDLSWYKRYGWFVAYLFQVKAPATADRLTTVSEPLKDIAIDHGINPNKIDVIPNACEPQLSPLIDNKVARQILNLPDAPLILVIGYPYPNGAYTLAFKIFFEALLELRNQEPKIRVLLVGEKVIPRSLEALYSSLRGTITEVGRVPLSKIPLYIRASDIVYFPMEDTIQDRTRWPLRFNDFLSGGRPIVSNAVGSVYSIIKRFNCGVIVDDNPSSICAHILSLLQDGNLRASYGKRAREVAENILSVNEVAKLLESTYLKALSGGEKDFSIHGSRNL